MARLVVSPGTPQAREVMLKPGINTIGRHEDNDLPIPDPSISEAHCQIIVSEGGVRLRDLGSTNGTFVNARELQKPNFRRDSNSNSAAFTCCSKPRSKISLSRRPRLLLPACVFPKSRRIHLRLPWRIRS